ncbi:hypothetical protein SARC_07493 [Sphaeroforma arctica JP610]|uniref:Exostosin GT47 domain-containing protein n=1 Tax=Sphaeroforma arctica JP610 TaxID=667725 RepID=A0A0L0FUB6_9EUKA|nr:hypothetical protein SARC_07493 [Sphaeroforma arctica JP610]KNC80141.1 hypothetical protein SARC_07493 [Sphaeroforma arctica JP610]|eukprot:XP_014154043.1 hypothetical protein SARC_07493 [Sphaeroforma arctica JP610]
MYRAIITIGTISVSISVLVALASLSSASRETEQEKQLRRSSMPVVNISHSVNDMQSMPSVATSVRKPLFGLISEQKDYADMRENMRIFIYPHEHLRMPLTREQVKMVDKGHAPRLVHDEGNGTFSIPIESDFIPFPSDGTFQAGSVIVNNMRSTPGLLTKNPKGAQFFFIPVSCSGIREVAVSRRSGGVLAEMALSYYIDHISHAYPHWNETMGANHFYICMHMGAGVSASSHKMVQKNVIAVVAAGDYSTLYFSPHKDISIPPHVASRQLDALRRKITRDMTETISTRRSLAFFAGRLDRGRLRPHLTKAYGRDTDIILRDHMSTSAYVKGLSSTRFCLVPRGTKVNSPRINEVLAYDCVPVIIADFYHLPYTGIVDWAGFSVIVPENDVDRLKPILESIPQDTYDELLSNVRKVRAMFEFHTPAAKEGDAFFAFLLMLWQKRHVISIESFATAYDLMHSTDTVESFLSIGTVDSAEGFVSP